MISCRSDIYKLVQDLQPRNIVRTHGGGFLLIDFSESRKHVCKEGKVQYTDILALLVANTQVGQRTPHPFRSGSTEVLRTANIAKYVMETAACLN